MKLNFIKDYVDKRIDEDGEKGSEVAESIGISTSMVSSYKNHKYNPSLSVAKKVYLRDNIVLHPFSEESLKFEIDGDNK